MEAEGKTMPDVQLGTFEKPSVPDPAIADAAFEISAAGGTSDIVNGTFGPVSCSGNRHHAGKRSVIRGSRG